MIDENETGFDSWRFRPPVSAGPRCGAPWPQEDWAFWCSLPPNHNGPHQEAGRGRDRAYLVLWADPDGDDAPFD